MRRNDYIRSLLLLGVLCLGLIWMVVPTGQSARLFAAGQCPVVQNTPNFTIAYGPVTINENPAPAGSVIEALSPRDTVVGCQTVQTAGFLPAMYIYGEDTTVSPAIPGMRDGETVTFHVDGNSATTSPVLLWHNNRTPQELQITGSSAQVVVSIPMAVGWNLVSLPNVAVNTPVGDALTSIAGKYNIVFAYRGCDLADPWKKYDPAALPFSNDLKTLENTLGLWIKMTEVATLTVSGASTNATSLPLCEGWNLAGVPSLQTNAPATLFAPISGCYSIVFAYRGMDSADPWKKYDPAALPFSNDLKQVLPGDGLWIKATQACTWTVGAP